MCISETKLSSIAVKTYSSVFNTHYGNYIFEIRVRYFISTILMALDGIFTYYYRMRLTYVYSNICFNGSC